jgi:mannose-1-phosphate guanylyltransferase / mannose-6-phosphate isomerase
LLADDGIRAMIVPVILCGGAGSRLWPASRESFPKQLIGFGEEQSLLQVTMDRVATEDFVSPVIITGQETRFIVADQVKSKNAEARIVIEPMRRDSCAAIVTAAFVVSAMHGDDAGMLVLAADHHIPDAAEFRATALAAMAAAGAGRIVTFGIVPDSPATGYGYIRPGAPIEGGGGARSVERFIEKPDAALAQRLIDEGHLWNSGNFLFKAGAFLEQARIHAPEVCAAVREAVDKASIDLDFFRLDAAAFSRSPAISVDYGIMEKSAALAVMPSRFRWSDIGSWDAAWQIADKDADGNGSMGDVEFHDSRNCLAYSPNMLTAVVGLEDIVVVSTRDAILVVARDKAQSVRDMVKSLQAKGRREAVEHVRSFRPWGDYESIDRGDRYQVKRITVKSGGILSLQSHFHRAEHWVVVSGTARVTINDAVTVVGENQSIYVPLGAVHRLENPGKVPLELIEVQSGAYLGEDDIVRHEDVYGRT